MTIITQGIGKTMLMKLKKNDLPEEIQDQSEVDFSKLQMYPEITTETEK